MFVIISKIDYIIYMKTYSLTLSSNQIDDLEKRYQGFEKRTDLQHTRFQIKGSDFTITAYKSGKVVFQGESASFHALQSGYHEDTLPSQSKPQKKSTPSQLDQAWSAGSDEVGTGDYFGPVVVCAAIIRPEDHEALPLHRIMDSKMIKDETIRELAPILKKHLKYSVLILDNRKYNKVHTVHNMNTIKAMLHNKAYLNLSEKFEMPDLAVVDQFMQASSYFKALKNEPNVYRKLHFETKAESKYLAVACASIIARAAFLEYFDKLSEKYEFAFPKGAGSLVDKAGKEFVMRFGKEALNDVAKTHFANTEKILSDFQL